VTDRKRHQDEVVVTEEWSSLPVLSGFRVLPFLTPHPWRGALLPPMYPDIIPDTSRHRDYYTLFLFLVSYKNLLSKFKQAFSIVRLNIPCLPCGGSLSGLAPSAAPDFPCWALYRYAHPRHTSLRPRKKMKCA
jgi:hypothetical protein